MFPSIRRTLKNFFRGISKTTSPKSQRTKARLELLSLERREVPAVLTNLGNISTTKLTFANSVEGDVDGIVRNDTVVIRRLATNFDKFEVLLNGTQVRTYDMTESGSLFIGTKAGNDTIRFEVTPENYRFILNGGVGSDSLIADRTRGNHFELKTPGAGVLNARSNFLEMENLTGGDSLDTFKFTGTGAVAGAINGGLGIDTLDFGSITGPLWVNAAEGGNVVNRVGSFFGIENIQGNGTGYIAGPNTGGGNIWDLRADASRAARGTAELTILPAGGVITAAKKTTGAAALGAISIIPASNTFVFSKFASLVGGSVSDTFRFNNQWRSNILSINGAGGVNTLDFSSATRNTLVNLSKRIAFFMEADIRADVPYMNVYSIQNVNTGSGKDILVGDALANRLDGGANDDLLIGRDGADVLLGGTGRDVLIGGFTAYDLDNKAIRRKVSHIVQVSSNSFKVVNEFRTGKVSTSNDRFRDTLIAPGGDDFYYVFTLQGTPYIDSFDPVNGDLFFVRNDLPA